MPRNKEGSTRIKNGKLYARVTYQDDNGKTKEICNRSGGKTAMKRKHSMLIKQ